MRRESIPFDEGKLLIDRIPAYPGEFNALAIVCFSCQDAEAVDQIHAAIVEGWRRSKQAHVSAITAAALVAQRPNRRSVARIKTVAMDTVLLLHHVHESEDGHADSKLIGVFSSMDYARAAQRQVQDQPGFRDSPEGFIISEMKVDRVEWREGFVTMRPGEE